MSRILYCIPDSFNEITTLHSASAPSNDGTETMSLLCYDNRLMIINNQEKAININLLVISGVYNLSED